MDKQLAWVEHLPPMRDALLGQSEVRLVGHVRVRDGLAGPERGQIGVPAARPFSLRRVQAVGIRFADLGEETSTENVACGVTGGAVTLNRKGGHWSRAIRNLNRRPKILWMAAFATGEERVLRHRAGARVNHPAIGETDVARDAV